MMFKKKSKVISLTIITLVFISLVVGLFFIIKDSSEKNSERMANITNIEPALDYPRWVISGCESAKRNPYMSKTIYRCDLDLFLVEEGAWETSIKYFNYNGKDLVGECTSIVGNDNCGDYEKSCKNSSLICTRGYIELATNGKMYEKGGEIKINYNVTYIHEKRNSVLKTYIEKRNNEKNWERLELLETRPIDGYFDKKINFVLNWNSKNEGVYRIVATNNLFEDLSDCSKTSGICNLKKYYSNEFEISSNENLDQTIENCVKEGELISILPLSISNEEWGECCAGLEENKTFEIIDGSCYHRKPVVCTNCPNGICGPGETECNCPQDCTKEEDISNWQIFKNEKYGYEIKFPTNFKRRKSATFDYWFGKLSIHTQGSHFLIIKYIHQDEINNAVNSYCAENLKDDRCENFNWDGFEEIIDWKFTERNKYNIEQSDSRVEIIHPDGGAIIISIDSPASSEEIKSKFRKIISTFKFIDSDLNNESKNENSELVEKNKFAYYIIPFFILALSLLIIWKKVRKNHKRNL